jgi:hypothetical protein
VGKAEVPFIGLGWEESGQEAAGGGGWIQVDNFGSEKKLQGGFRKGLSAEGKPAVRGIGRSARGSMVVVGGQRMKMRESVWVGWAAQDERPAVPRLGRHGAANWERRNGLHGRLGWKSEKDFWCSWFEFETKVWTISQKQKFGIWFKQIWILNQRRFPNLNWSLSLFGNRRSKENSNLNPRLKPFSKIEILEFETKGFSSKDLNSKQDFEFKGGFWNS